MTKGTRRGFTLIELLVVIAIIAILAAILFPVFAQAREKARQITCLSNTKQLTLAINMYIEDYDEIMPLACDLVTLTIWTARVQPYARNWGVYYCPSGSGKRLPASMDTPANQDMQHWQFCPQYGLNASYLNRAQKNCSDMMLNGNAFGPPVPLASVNQPAATVMLSETGQLSPEDNLGSWVVYPPGALTADDVCTYGDWGNNANLYYAYFGRSSMGFFLNRHTQGGNVTFVDGHAKLMSPGALAAGTNWQSTMALGTVQITDRSVYLWDLN